jgi:hypothetical protein
MHTGLCVSEDVEFFLAACLSPSGQQEGRPVEPFPGTLRALAGGVGHAPSPEQQYFARELRAQLRRALATITGREREMLVRHQGLFGEPEETLRQVDMKLGKEELAYRQHVRNIDRLLNWDGIIRRKNRAAFERYLTHPDVRVREYANEVKEHNDQWRQELRELYEAERREEERYEQYLADLVSEDEACDEKRNRDREDLGEIPF